MSSSQEKIILVIEDEQESLRLLEYRLKKRGFHVVTSPDGQDGLDKIREVVPDLIILDLNLPKVPGEMVCKEIREGDDETLAQIPIFMLTGKDSEVDRIVGRVIGADQYFVKPYDADRLVDTINDLFQTH